MSSSASSNYTTKIPLLESGDYAIIAYPNPWFAVSKVVSIEETIEGIAPGKTIKKEVRISDNGKFYSPWIDFEKLYKIQFNPNDKLFIEIKYTRGGNENSTPMYITTFQLNVEQVETNQIFDKKPMCQECVSGGFFQSDPQNKFCVSEFLSEVGKEGMFKDLENCDDFALYDIAKAVNTWRDINTFVSNRYGLDVDYYKVEPDRTTDDSVLKEFGIYNASNKKCIKVMVEGNEIPENNFQFNQFGIDYQDFEVLIDFTSFENVFGDKAEPHKRDFMYIPIMNQMYEVTSAYLVKKMMNVGGWWKLGLVKAADKINVIKPTDVMTWLDEHSTSTEEVTLPQVEQEVIDVTNPQQLNNETFAESIFRDSVDDCLTISDIPLNNNYTMISNHHYELNSAYNQFEEPKYAVVYKQKAKLNQGDSFAFTTWFQPTDVGNYKPNSYPGAYIQSLFYDTNTLSVIIDFKRQHRLTNNTFVEISGAGILNGFYRISYISENSISIYAPTLNANLLPQITSTFAIKQTHPIILFDGYNVNTKQGLSIIIFNKSILRIYTNAKFYDYDFGVNLIDDWYSLVVQYANITKQLEVILWRKSAYATVNSNQQSTNLVKAFYHLEDIGEFAYDANTNYALIGSPVCQTAIRFMSQVIPIEKQSVFLNTAVVKDAHLGLILDNAEPVLKYEKIGHNK